MSSVELQPDQGQVQSQLRSKYLLSLFGTWMLIFILHTFNVTPNKLFHQEVYLITFSVIANFFTLNIYKSKKVSLAWWFSKTRISCIFILHFSTSISIGLCILCREWNMYAID